MRVFVLSSRAAVLRVQDSRLLIDDYFNRTRYEFRPHELPFELLVLNNTNGNLSLSAVKFLVKHGVPILLLDWNGAPCGQFLPSGPINGELQIAQLRASLDPTRRKEIATAILEEKYAKTLQLTRHLSRFYPEVRLAALEREISSSVPERGKDYSTTLMVKEGRVAMAFFREYSKVVQRLAPELEFTARGQSSACGNMSASDPFNSVLNLGYGVLECWVRAAVNEAGLNENVGFLHEAQPGALPLVYDAMEPFRWLVDYSLIRLLENGVLHLSDFTTTSDYRVRVKPDAVRKVVDELATNFGRMARTDSVRRSYDTILSSDIRKLVRYITGQSSSLDLSYPFTAGDLRTEIETRKRLLGLTVEDRKRLGIPKTTLWYIQRDLRRGGPRRLYSKTGRLVDARGDSVI